MASGESAKRVATLAQPDVRPSAFVHFVLKTNRYEEQIAFYKTFLNAWVVFGNEQATFMTYDDEHHRLAIANAGGALSEMDPGAAGFDHLSWAFSSLGDLLANYSRLKDAGILPYWCINHGPSTSLYYKDVDGNQVETQADNFDTHEELFAFYRTDTFANNILGVQFDPEKLIELYRQGVPETDLKKQGSAPRAPGTEFVFPG